MNIRSSKKHLSDIYLQDKVGTDKDGNEITLEDKIAETNPKVSLVQPKTY